MAEQTQGSQSDDPHQDLKPEDRELEDVVFDFQDVLEDLNYRQAQDALRELVNNLDLTAQEQVGLESEIHCLGTMLTKLDQQVIQLVVFGMVGRGKSSVLNALLGQAAFETGPLHGVTQTVQRSRWGEGGGDRPLGVTKLALQGIGSSQIELIDTPGIDEVNGDDRDRMARELAQQADLILFVVAGDITTVEYDALSLLRQANKPMLLVFNKVDQYPEADRVAIYNTLKDQRVRDILSPDEIVMVSAAPLVARAVRRADGSVAVEQHRGAPQVEALKLKILEILHRDGKSLVALNTMLYADDVNEKLVQRKMEIRDRAANQVIWNSVMTKAVAIALNPVTVVDVLSSAVIDVALILTLSKLYGITMTQYGAVELLQKIAVGMGGITASELLVTLGLGSLKSLLGLSATVTGGASLAPYLAVALTQAGVAGVSSYAIGQVTKIYLANGASWGAEGPRAVMQKIVNSLDEASIINRIKGELTEKLDMRGRSPKP